jgi:arabinofuranosyltransferase
MKKNRPQILIVSILLAAGILLFFGWKLFWFLTDDALIAFRYVSNGLAGYGYVWNPPPFNPVEGYTSFLWVVLLDLLWRIFGLKPPEVVNDLSLGFSYLTLLVVAAFVLRMKLQPGLARLRPAFLALILLLVLTNRTFLTWTSSGMETAMFNFFFILWIFIAVRLVLGGPWGFFGLAFSAVFVYLARPDGILPLLCTLFLLVRTLVDNWREEKLSPKWLLSALPLLIPVSHLVWRRSFYGEWLPNTYYAKSDAAWPEAGLRYLSSFVLEYALWIWGAVLVAYLFPRYKISKTLVNQWSGPDKRGIFDRFWLLNRPPGFYAVATLALQVGYYTFIIGGDHFEYRVYSHLVPLIALSFLWLLNGLDVKPKKALRYFSTFLLLSLPLPWTHWILTKDLKAKEQVQVMRVSVSPHVPFFLRWYTQPFDDFQFWLITHHIGMRHQEHKRFYERHSRMYPTREEGENFRLGGYPILVTRTVGVPGWTLPHVNILDELGLNDYVIARSPFKSGERLMAHSRFPPPGYVESFAPNVSMPEVGRLDFLPRDEELTADYIRKNEAYWIEQVNRYKKTPAR